MRDLTIEQAIDRIDRDKSDKIRKVPLNPLPDNLNEGDLASDGVYLYFKIDGLLYRSANTVVQITGD